MKVNHIATQALFNQMRNATAHMQSELSRLQQEAVTGRMADAGLALGERAQDLVSFRSDIAHVEGTIDANQIAMSRLDMTQTGLGQLTGLADGMVSTLGIWLGEDGKGADVAKAAASALTDMTGVLNLKVNGSHIFAGLNTQAAPVAEHVGGPGQAAFEAAFASHFGFAKTDPAAATITAADMTDFLETVIEPDFMGAGWTSRYSSATDAVIRARIGPEAVTDASVSANEEAIRQLALSAVVALESHGAPLSAEARRAAGEFALSRAASASGALAQLQGDTGLIEARIERQNQALAGQRDILQTIANQMEAVDRFEASARLTGLLTQIEASYAVTARIQQMSLVRYL
ncbi:MULTISPECIES: flagellar hook-associated family protein [unclassified Roseitalea]|uniref:flagellar hook-associated family protein n=1 Tax=unclassified Roseitalea TaxID=2639107 RepID=UPI00273D7843|nr:MULTISPECIES: flagellar hook-associated family protein [unclassified Roseitalea]